MANPVVDIPPWAAILGAIGVGTFAAAVVAGLVALVGHRVSVLNAKLQAEIADGASRLAAEISRGNAALSAEVAREASEQSNRISRDNARLSAKLGANLKLAEMRQAWINRLRADMAEFQAMAVTPDLDFQRETKFYQLMAGIELAINPADEDYEELSRTLYRYIEGAGIEEKRANDAPYVMVCQRILKREWDVLKAEIRAVTEDPNASWDGAPDPPPT